MGETSAVLRVIEAGTQTKRSGQRRDLGARDSSGESVASVETVQTVYDLLNPSAARAVPSHFYAQEFGQLIPRAATHGIGVIVIRVLAAGALSGADAHRLASRGGPPMGTSSEFSEDVAKAERFRFLVDEDLAEDPAEGAIRFALANADVSMVLVGFSSVVKVERAAASEEKGPLPAELLGRLSPIWESFCP